MQLGMTLKYSICGLLNNYMGYTNSNVQYNPSPAKKTRCPGSFYLFLISSIYPHRRHSYFAYYYPLPSHTILKTIEKFYPYSYIASVFVPVMHATLFSHTNVSSIPHNSSKNQRENPIMLECDVSICSHCGCSFLTYDERGHPTMLLCSVEHK